jgi:hypothetical protein
LCNATVCHCSFHTSGQCIAANHPEKRQKREAGNLSPQGPDECETGTSLQNKHRNLLSESRIDPKEEISPGLCAYLQKEKVPIAVQNSPIRERQL